MLDPETKSRIIDALANATPRNVERDALIYATMAAATLQLEGVDTSPEQILNVVRSREAKRAEIWKPSPEDKCTRRHGSLNRSQSECHLVH